MGQFTQCNTAYNVKYSFGTCYLTQSFWLQRVWDSSFFGVVCVIFDSQTIVWLLRFEVKLIWKQYFYRLGVRIVDHTLKSDQDDVPNLYKIDGYLQPGILRNKFFGKTWNNRNFHSEYPSIIGLDHLSDQDLRMTILRSRGIKKSFEMVAISLMDTWKI